MRVLRWLFRFQITSPIGVLGLVLAALFVTTIGAPFAVRHVPSWWWLNIAVIRVTNDDLSVTVERTVARSFTGAVRASVRQVSILEVVPPDSLTGERPERSGASCDGPRLEGQVFVAGSTFMGQIQDGPRKSQVRDLPWYFGAPPNRFCDLAPGTYRARFTYYYPWPNRGPLRGLIEFQTSADSNMFSVGDSATNR